jgi:amino acid transporter
VFGILSFIGFDAAATLGEETRDARRNVPLAVGGTLVVCGLFYLVTISALATGDLTDPNPFLALARTHAPWLEHAVALCAVGCLFSCYLAIHNTTARILFAMGRDRVLPGALGRVHPRWQSPHVAVCAQGLLTLAIGLPLGFWIGPGPAGAYGFTGAIGAVAIILVWMLGGIALVRYSVREGNCRPVRSVVLPLVGVLALVYPLWATVDADDSPGQAYRSYWVPAVVLAWLILGAVAFGCIRWKAPHKLAAIGSSLADDVPASQLTKLDGAARERLRFRPGREVGAEHADIADVRPHVDDPARRVAGAVVLQLPVLHPAPLLVQRRADRFHFRERR